MSLATSELQAAWATAGPFQAPFAASSFPILALTTMTAGLFFAAKFGLAEKPVFVNDLAASVGSSIFLGFGIVFVFLAVGLYV
ncbi:hypothetical protein EMPS_05570 [Entomortierella parvispora]|uniref:Dolichyl-diphosphooligosaccharide-protein glycosyltransferase subunit OST5 n=1 Tax=Entomortierella parvispora TaxID=205924 RepID=A0A9P3HAQ3_9FUNG|nr:hypothetical protein EMPS_05570 [Entomortierella parvispora]